LRRSSGRFLLSAAEQMALDQCRASAEAGGPQGGNDPRRAAADGDQVILSARGRILPIRRMRLPD
jgi:hypothetical protein